MYVSMTYSLYAGWTPIRMAVWTCAVVTAATSMTGAGANSQLLQIVNTIVAYKYITFSDCFEHFFKI